jgi:acylphosphatase
MEQRVAFRALVSGRVQGVFYRDSTRRHAQSLRMTGWARNLPDGRVEVYAVGYPAACQSLLEFLRVGPPRAEVTDVDVQWEAPPDALPREFEIR